MTINEVDKCNDFIIGIRKFLSHYYYINVDSAEKLSHEAFMEIFGLKAISSGKIELEEVVSGRIILVSDTYERVYGYRNPLIIDKTEDDREFFITDASIEFEQETKDEIDLESVNLEELSDYELDRLLMRSKKSKDERVKNRIIKELKFRPDSKPGKKGNLIEKVRKREFDNEKMKGDLL